MSSADKQIIEMHLSEGDDGELHYTQEHSIQRRSALSYWIIKLLGFALGVAAFLFMIVFFVYVIIPIVAILIIYSLVKRFFR